MGAGPYTQIGAVACPCNPPILTRFQRKIWKLRRKHLSLPRFNETTSVMAKNIIIKNPPKKLVSLVEKLRARKVSMREELHNMKENAISINVQ
jgi:hypothetical protein